MTNEGIERMKLEADNARLREEVDFMTKRYNTAVEKQHRVFDQRDTLLAALNGGTFSLDYDEQQHDYVLHYHASYEEAEAIKAAISEVAEEKGEK